MSHGGAREGAGRPVGSKQRVSRDLEERVRKMIEDGEANDPIEGMLRLEKRLCDSNIIEELQLAQQCRKDAAPYLYAKLQAVQVSGQMTVGVGLADIVKKAVEE